MFLAQCHACETRFMHPEDRPPSRCPACGGSGPFWAAGPEPAAAAPPWRVALRVLTEAALVLLVVGGAVALWALAAASP